MTAEDATVSVVVVDDGDIDQTINALRSVHDAEWPAERLEVVTVVDDDQVERVRREFLTTRVLPRSGTPGRAAESNLAARHASGRHLAFLDAAATCDAQWLTAAVAVLEEDDTIGCVASRIVGPGGTDVVHEAAIGFDAQPVIGSRVGQRSDVLAPSRSGMVMPTATFREVGEFDARFFRYLEDIDLCWRVWLAGLRVCYAPSSIIQLSAMPDDLDSAPAFLRERNALFTLYKNLDGRNLDRVLPATLLLSTRRGMERAGVRSEQLDPAVAPDDVVVPTDVSGLLASVAAQDAFLSHLPELRTARSNIQARRRCEDARVLALFRHPYPATASDVLASTVLDIVSEFELDAVLPARRVLVITNDVLGPRMAGPAIRAREIAATLAVDHDVTLVSLVGSDLHEPTFHVCQASGSELQRLVDWCEVIVFQGHFLQHNPWVVGLDRKILVVDLYDPFQLENLVMGKHLHLGHRIADNRTAIESLDEQLARGDFFLCASEKQRDFWMGSLSALGRLNPHVYDDDASLRNLIDVVPFGLPEKPPTRTGPGVRGTVPGISATDKVIIWAGGIYNWFDPCTLIRAMAHLRELVPEVRLFFMGMKHPNPEVPAMRVAADAVALARDLGLLDTHVFFNDGWIPYDARQNYLLDADVGVSTHFDHSETAYSFRTRILDYFWAQLPVVTTAGDAMADIVAGRGVGAVVPPEDEKALCEALHRLLTDELDRSAIRERLTTLRQEFTWPRSLRPLTEFCRSARPAPDRQYATVAAPAGPTRLGAPAAASARRWRGIGHDLAVAQAMIAEGGVRRLATQAGIRLRRLVSRPRL